MPARHPAIFIFSELIKALKARDPEARFCFLGGDLMAAAAGVRPVVHYRDMAYMGFGQVVRHLPDVTRNLDIARRLLDRLRPDVFIPSTIRRSTCGWHRMP